jgi:hypothetical protein
MKEPYGKGLATRPGPESCAGGVCPLAASLFPSRGCRTRTARSGGGRCSPRSRTCLASGKGVPGFDVAGGLPVCQGETPRHAPTFARWRAPAGIVGKRLALCPVPPCRAARRLAGGDGGWAKARPYRRRPLARRRWRSLLHGDPLASERTKGSRPPGRCSGGVSP